MVSEARSSEQGARSGRREAPHYSPRRIRPLADRLSVLGCADDTPVATGNHTDQRSEGREQQSTIKKALGTSASTTDPRSEKGLGYGVKGSASCGGGSGSRARARA